MSCGAFGTKTLDCRMRKGQWATRNTYFYYLNYIGEYFLRQTLVFLRLFYTGRFFMIIFIFI